jgi:hypothetical protein
MADCRMIARPAETSDADRRELPDRRAGSDRRGPDRRVVAMPPTPPPLELRAAKGRRGGAERRAGRERRSRETVEEHVRNALQLLVSIADTGSLDDDLRRDLDAAMFRLRYAVERLRYGEP